MTRVDQSRPPAIAHGQNLGDHRMQAMQGVTTVLELESGVLPIGDWYEAQAELRLPLNYGTSAAWTFARIATYTGTEPEATPADFQDVQRAIRLERGHRDPRATNDESISGVDHSPGYLRTAAKLLAGE